MSDNCHNLYCSRHIDLVDIEDDKLFKQSNVFNLIHIIKYYNTKTHNGACDLFDTYFIYPGVVGERTRIHTHHLVNTGALVYLFKYGSHQVTSI